MVTQVEDSRFIGCRGILHLQFVGIGPCVNQFAVELSRVAFLAIRADVSQLQCGKIFALYRLGFPDPLVKSARPAMNVVRPVIRR
ncbi:hypothetical protein SDC9_169009 [bioreactor metagenome]|uniref:Uncharacterized protein n=1 Tax=bioreactor metagenome TaxID=1076179 RepID=A0A645G756_9ZZZZ